MADRSSTSAPNVEGQTLSVRTRPRDGVRGGAAPNFPCTSPSPLRVPTWTSRGQEAPMEFRMIGLAGTALRPRGVLSI